MYTMRAVLGTPNYADDEDVIYALEFEDKKGLHKVESALIRALGKLEKLTEAELTTGKKPFAGSNPQLVIFDVAIKKGDVDFGGYTFRWPNQTDVAREYLRGLLDGLMQETGYGGKRATRKSRR
jgi:hypothetical protein